MSEVRLQYEIVTWFNNKVPQERGTLFAIMNETNKGATKRGLGLLPGASDLGYIAPSGEFIGFELKVIDSRHPVEHLKRQLEFAERITKRGGLGFFVFSLDHFKHIMANIVTSGVTIFACDIAEQSRNFIARSIEKAEIKGTKTVKLEWNGLK